MAKMQNEATATLDWHKQLSRNTINSHLWTIGYFNLLYSNFSVCTSGVFFCLSRISRFMPSLYAQPTFAFQSFEPLWTIDSSNWMVAFSTGRKCLKGESHKQFKCLSWVLVEYRWRQNQTWNSMTFEIC